MVPGHVVGACLLAGLFTRLACLVGAGFLVMTYLTHPPFPWYPLPPNTEGNPLFVNKNVIEALALLVLAMLPDRPVARARRACSPGRAAAARTTLNAGIAHPRQRVATLPTIHTPSPGVGIMALDLTPEQKATGKANFEQAAGDLARPAR